MARLPLRHLAITCGRLLPGLAMLATAWAAVPAQAQDWPRFRGPNGSGVSSWRFPTRWEERDYAWQVELPGRGHSSPVVVGSRLFLTAGEEESGRRLVLCLDARSGQMLWRRSFAGETHRKHQLNTFASSTPAADSRRVYVTWATPRHYWVRAFSHRGELLWERDLGTFRSGHGHGVSPIVYQNLLIVPNEQEGPSRLVALDCATGQEVWSLARESRTTYSTPCVFRPPGSPPALIFTNWHYGITAHDPRTGRTIWQAQVFGRPEIETAIGSPIVAGPLVIGTCGWLGRTVHLVAVRPEKQGTAWTVKTAFHHRRAAPLTTTPVAARGLLYFWSDQGIATCCELPSGKVVWRRRVGGTYYGSPIYAGGALYALSADGEAVVLAAGRRFRVLGRMDLGQPSNSTPAVAHGRMYLRTVSRLYCLQATGREEAAP